MSALSSGNKFEGVDFVRLWCLPLLARDRLCWTCPLAWSSTTGIGAVATAVSWCVCLLLHMRRTPTYTNLRTKRTSLLIFQYHDLRRMCIDLSMRKGSTVKTYSHASRQPSTPNHITPSRWNGSSKKLSSLSIFTVEDSYGKSELTLRCMYIGEGRCDESSSWRQVDSDSGGKGTSTGVGDDARGKASSIFLGTSDLEAARDLRWSCNVCIEGLLILAGVDKARGGRGSPSGEVRRPTVSSAPTSTVRFRGRFDPVARS